MQLARVRDSVTRQECYLVFGDAEEDSKMYEAAAEFLSADPDDLYIVGVAIRLFEGDLGLKEGDILVEPATWTT